MLGVYNALAGAVTEVKKIWTQNQKLYQEIEEPIIYNIMISYSVTILI